MDFKVSAFDYMDFQRSYFSALGVNCGYEFINYFLINMHNGDSCSLSIEKALKQIEVYNKKD